MTANIAAVTPMMAQFLEIKERYKDALLFYRMGDFYEMFFDDAVAAATALDIALTKRGKHLGEDIPMCGVPVHAAEGYLLTLIRKGFRVAVCEQMEDPTEAKKRGSKSVVKRDVVRLVTPGTLTEDSLLEARRHNFLAAFCEVRDTAALAWIDISTGAFRVMQLSRTVLSPELARIAPAELILTDGFDANLADIVSDLGISLTPLGRSSFDSTAAEKRICDAFGIGSIEAFGGYDRAELGAMGALVDYLEITQKGKLPLLQRPIAERRQSSMQIDAATRRNLELTRSLDGRREGSLLSAIDQTISAGGARLLEHRLSSPSRDLNVIQGRLDAVQFFIENSKIAVSIREVFRTMPDVSRSLSRLGIERGGPRDLAAVRNTLIGALSLHNELSSYDLPTILAEKLDLLVGHDSVLDELDSALVAEPPLLARDGGFIASEYDSELDETRLLRDEGRSIIAKMQVEFVEKTEITALKIKHNNVLGYFVETPATHAEKMLSERFSDTFIHRQTTANAVRFTTLELRETETRILNSGSHAIEIEKRHYKALADRILDNSAALINLATALAELDVSVALAHLATQEDWVRPSLVPDSTFLVEGGRHPVVQQALNAAGGTFISNDCLLSDGQVCSNIWLLTGPNMAGKSTFLRQNAVIAILAQIGSFVPAARAEIGIVSQVFSRVGASDDLARGRSTFMVEMVETAAILNQADENALVILDEIGRGTATYDGLSIAWATLEQLHEVNQCRVLFATHYHELTQLSERLSGIKNATMAVKEWEGEVVFLHEVRSGAADRSYGVQVAKLAGLPPAVIERAKDILAQLESGAREGRAAPLAVLDDLPLFSAMPTTSAQVSSGPSAVEERLAEVHPDELTPKAALELVYALKALASD